MHVIVSSEAALNRRASIGVLLLVIIRSLSRDDAQAGALSSGCTEAQALEDI